MVPGSSDITPGTDVGVGPAPSTVLLKAGLIAVPGGRFVDDLLIENGWVSAIGSISPLADAIPSNGSGKVTKWEIDAMGLIMLPGWVLPCLQIPSTEPPHQELAEAGVTCAGWVGPLSDDGSQGPWSCDLVSLELIEEAEQIVSAADAIYKYGRVAFLLAADRGSTLVDVAAPVLASLRSTLIIMSDGQNEKRAVSLAERASSSGGRVIVGPLRRPPLIYRAAASGVIAATDPAWLVDDPGLWKAVSDGALRMLVSSSGRPPSLGTLYRSGPARGLASLETLAALIASRPAALLGCSSKGLLSPGRHGDLCLLEAAGGKTTARLTLLRGSNVCRPHGRLMLAEPAEGFV